MMGRTVMDGVPFDIRAAGADDLEAMLPLFIGYREFYRLAPEEEESRRFLARMLASEESAIFLAFLGAEKKAVGLMQLFPTNSSASLRRIWILNDLFVAPEARRLGVGRRLLEQAREFGAQTGAARLMLRTEVSNTQAQSLYEAMGWKRDEVFYTYNLTL
jgi:GNAT superfamily N-acetyltransferase